CVGVGGLYKKVCWVDLHGKWVYERPTRSFRLGLWEVVPEIERNFPEDKIRRQDLKYVVWCQKWCIEDKLGSTCPYGYFLYRIQKHFNDFAKRTEIQTDEMFFGIFLDGKPYQCTVPVKQFNQIRSEGEHYPYTPSPELFDASQFGENVIPFIVVEGMK
ncbi:hypothetical protein CL630_00050, partial [bacterium]|nr:hypothetical protein [bacterium]